MAGTKAPPKNVELRPFELRDGAAITILHPLDSTAKALETWGQLFSEYEIVQPFPQLGRERASVDAREGRVPRFAGVELAAGALLGLERRGHTTRPQ